MDASGQSWDAARNLLCVRLDTIGDVLMCTPAIRALKEARPARRITLLSSASGAAIASLVPEIDEVIEYAAPWMKPASGGASDDRAMLQGLRARAFDGAVIFTSYSQSALPAATLCRLAGIPLVAAHVREKPYALVSDAVPECEPQRFVRHEVRRQLDLVSAIGAEARDERMSLAAPDVARVRVAGLLASIGIEATTPWCVIHPGSTASSRRYPAERFAAAARALAGDHGWRIVVTGDAGERALAEQVASAAGERGHSVAGRLDLGEMAALIATAPELVSNNSGPVHIAAALGTPIVDLYALTNPQHTPWLVPHRLLFRNVACRNCYASVCPQSHHRCLLGVSAGEVVDAAVSLASESGRLSGRRHRSATPTRLESAISSPA
jgi:lipopolysaccharide heptosyltransferase II